ncbi:MAG: hypothetical protein B7Z64_09905, partial [Acidiphilium sp. 21-68-69]
MSTSKYHHGDLRQSLIEAGATLLRDEGRAGLTLRAASRIAGVSPTASYRHFADKDALLEAIADHGFALLEAALRAADTDPDDRAALCRQGVAYVEFAVAHPDLFRLMFSGVHARRNKSAGHAARHGAFAVLADRVARRVGPAKAATITLAAWSIVHGLAALIVEQRVAAPDPAALAARIVPLLNL